MIDYLEIDTKHREFVRKIQNKYVKLYQTLSPRPETPHHTIRHHPYKNR